MGSRRIKEHEETNITNVGTKSIVSEKEKKIRKKKITVKNNSVIKKNNNTNTNTNNVNVKKNSSKKKVNINANKNINSNG